MRSLVCLCSLVLLAMSNLAAATGLGDQQNLDVLYAGKPGSERMADFERFLSSHFERVGTVSLETFTPDDAAEFDVVILDWISIYPRDDEGNIQRENFSLRMPRFPVLPKDWSKPTIMIGSVAARVGGHPNHQLKFDWL